MRQVLEELLGSESYSEYLPGLVLVVLVSLVISSRFYQTGRSALDQDQPFVTSELEGQPLDSRNCLDRFSESEDFEVD